MQELVQPYTEQEKYQVGLELERLFILQDKPLADAKKVILLNELCGFNFPMGALLQGIRSLRQEDMRSLKLSHLVDAVRKYVDINAGRIACEFCGWEGAVMMFDDEQRLHALACKCSNGDTVAKAQGLARWNGQPIMMLKDRRLYRNVEDCGSSTVVPGPALDPAVQELLDAVGGKVVV